MRTLEEAVKALLADIAPDIEVPWPVALDDLTDFAEATNLTVLELVIRAEELMETNS